MEACSGRKAAPSIFFVDAADYRTQPCATYRAPPPTTRCRPTRRSKEKPRSRARRTLLRLLRAGLPLANIWLADALMTHISLAQFQALAFHQCAQVVQQLRVPLAQNFYQERKRQRRSRTGVQPLPQGLPRRFTMYLLAAEAGSVAVRSSFFRASQTA